MAYCTTADVILSGVHGNTTFTTATVPTSNQVTEAINKIAREIDSKLYSSDVTVPVDSTTSPNAYALLKDLNVIGAAAEVERIAFNEYDQKTPEDMKAIGSYRNQFESILREYCEYPVKLRDAVLGSSHKLLWTKEKSTPWSGTMDRYDYDRTDEEEENSLEPEFKSEDKW